MRAMPLLQRRLRFMARPRTEIVSAGSGRAKKLKSPAIPVLKVNAASLGEKGDDAFLLDVAPVEAMIAAPSDWCPHPAHTTCVRVQGDSMMPLIGDGYVVAVDSLHTERAALDGKVV